MVIIEIRTSTIKKVIQFFPTYKLT